MAGEGLLFSVNFQQVSAGSSGLVSIGETFLEFSLWWLFFPFWSYMHKYLLDKLVSGPRMLFHLIAQPVL